MAERIATLEVAQARVEERVTDVEEYQQKQNGSLQRLEAKMDRIQQWLVGLLGGVVCSLLLLIFQLYFVR